MLETKQPEGDGEPCDLRANCFVSRFPSDSVYR